MGIYLNPGSASFERAVNSEIYVDKTGLLEYTNKVLRTEQSCICFSRPRRFGKSMAVGMLTAYYSRGCSAESLFQGLKISDSPEFKKHLNQYNVIRLDLTSFSRPDESPLEMVRRMNHSVIEELKEAYKDAVPKEEDYLPSALATVNEKTGHTFIIIIDEWDAIFRENKSDQEAQRFYIEWLRGLFKGEQPKNFLLLAYITGILPIKKYNSESALNNFDEFTMANPAQLAEYVGFTEDEVKDLCKSYGMDFSEAARWYDGYSFRRLQHIYSPNSVINAMIKGAYSDYWTRTVAYESLREYISMNYDGLKDSIVRMLAGGRCRVNIGSFENDMTSFKRRDDVLAILIHLGYLAYDGEKKEVFIPNEEVRTEFVNAVMDTDWTPVIQALRASEELLKATWRMDADTVAVGIDKVHMENTSILAYNDENALSCVVALAYYHARSEYMLVREMPAGRGYADMVFLPRKHSDKPAMIIELKYDKTAEGAIEQIKEKGYVEALKGYKGRVLLVGINYDKRLKKHGCLIEEAAV